MQFRKDCPSERQQLHNFYCCTSNEMHNTPKSFVADCVRYGFGWTQRSRKIHRNTRKPTTVAKEYRSILQRLPTIFAYMHFFFSDAHLGLGQAAARRQRERTVVQFLRMVGQQQAESLFIVGDLFDYWFDYRTVIPREFVRVLAAIADLVDAGIRVEYVIGNHDFGHRDYFQNELGVTVHTDDVMTTIAGRRCYLSHGDGKAFNDTGYLILKKLLRARPSNKMFRALHPDVGIGLAMWASRRSRDYTSQKNYGTKSVDAEKPGESDGLYAFAEKKILQEGFQLVVMGHSHTPRRVDLEGGTYINLGAWLKDRYYLQLTEDDLTFQPFTQ